VKKNVQKQRVNCVKKVVDKFFHPMLVQLRSFVLFVQFRRANEIFQPSFNGIADSFSGLLRAAACGVFSFGQKPVHIESFVFARNCDLRLVHFLGVYFLPRRYQ
jgi:hypothetical protein